MKQANQRDGVGFWRLWGKQERIPAPQRRFGRRIPSYARLDVRLGWQLAESMGPSVVGGNLLEPWHFEFGPAYMLNPTQAKRSVYGRITWRF